MRRGLALAASVVVVIGAACSNGDGDGSSSAGALPANDERALAAPFASEFRELGLRVTRAALVERSTGKPGPDTTHLAVYVEPTGRYSPDDFATGLVTVTQAFLPEAFDRWSGLTSFDVCQEPERGVDDREVPAPRTQIDISREAVATVDWDTVELGELLEGAAREADDTFTVFADDTVTASPTYQEQVGAGTANPGPTGDASY